MSLRNGGLGRVLCALDIEHEEWGPLAISSVMAEYFHVPLDALYAARSGAWEDRTERVRRLIAEHSARERLDQLIAPLATTIAVTASVQRGAAGDVILQQASESHAGLIVLGSADRRSFGSGSHRLAMTIASTATAAVLTVPSDARACAVQRILVLITSATAARPALKWATALAGRFGASVSLARMAPPASWFGAGLFGPTRRSQDATRRRATLVERSLDRLREADIAVSEEPEQLDATGLARLAAEGAFDLVVVGLPAALDPGAEEIALVERLRQCSLVPVLSVRARVRRSSQALWAGSPQPRGSGTIEYAA
ncbi:MAG TPA: universal stress protein [Polyangiaceae bacterium]|nr:universal stress protein [Polyangiaceae bacterium]